MSKALAFYVVLDKSILTVYGRKAWALRQLYKAREKGCSSMDSPAPRWSGYVFQLRQMGFEIETVREPHKGPFPGTHARYVLRSDVLMLPVDLGQGA